MTAMVDLALWLRTPFIAALRNPVTWESSRAEFVFFGVDLPSIPC